MTTALALLRVARDEVNAVAQKLADMEGITEVYSVAGRYALVAVIRVKENEKMAEVVTDNIRKVKGIERSETLIAFRVYSRYDLEMAFSSGMERKAK